MMTKATVGERYETALKRYGQRVLIRRLAGTGLARVGSDYQTFARITETPDKNLVGGTSQGEYTGVISATALAKSQFPGAPVVGDKMVIGEKELQIVQVDAHTRAIGTGISAYVVQLRG